MVKNFIRGLQLGYTLFMSTVILTTLDFVINIIKSPISNYMDFIAWLYFIPTAIGHAALFSHLLFIVYFLVLFITLSKRVSLYVYIFLAIFLQMIIVLDGLVFDIYRFHINGFVIQLILGAGANIFIFGAKQILKFGLLTTLVAILPYIIISILTTKNYTKLKIGTAIVTSTVLIIFIIFSHVGHAVAAGVRQVSIQKSATILPYFFPLTMNTLLLKMGITNKNDFVEIHDQDVSDINYPRNTIHAEDSIPNYNIIYILIDSWNPSTFDKNTTPNIHNFAQIGNTFTNHFSSSSGTHGSIFGLFFGAPLTYKKDFQLADKSPVLIDQLIEKGYDIEVFPSAIFTAPPISRGNFQARTNNPYTCTRRHPFPKRQHHY